MKSMLHLVFNTGKRVFLLAVLSFAFGFVFTAHGQSIVYIDPTYSGGSNDGSIDHPYLHWSNIPGYPDNLLDNTSYLQKRGTKDTINANIHPYQNTGITFSVYGTGTDYATIINKKAGGKTFDITASRHITVDGFHLKGTITGSGAATNYTTLCGVSIAADWDNTSTFVAYNTTVKNCFIEKSTSGIRAFNSGFNPFDTIIIENVKIHDIYEDGMYIQLSTSVPFYGLDINNCYIDSVNMGYNIRGGDETLNPGDGIQLVDLVSTFQLRNTTIDRRNSSNKFCFISGNNVLHHLNRGLIENCTFYAPNVGFGGCALYLDDLDSIIVRNNHIFCNEKSTIMMLRNGTSMACYYNTFTGMTSGKSYIGFDMVASGPNKFDNNTFYKVQTVFQTNGTISEVYNNIFSNTGLVYPSSVETSPDNNLYFNATGSGIEPHSIYSQDPLFVDPANGDFRLQGSSPCIDKGRNLGYTSDIAGTSLPNGAGYDIGAYEYASSDTLPPSVPSGLVSGNISYTSFTLSWNPSTDNVGVTGYDIYKNGTLVTSVTDTTTNIEGLTQGKTYTMMVRAKDGNGNLSAADTLSVNTPASSDTQAPSVPAGLNASSLTATSFTLSWTASTDNVKVTEYDVYQDGVLVAIVAGDSANITGLSTGLTYAMTVTAKDTVGNTSAASSALNVTTILVCTGSDGWSNISFANQTGNFTAEYDATPQSGTTVGITGLSDGRALAYASLACIMGFNADGTVTARDKGVYHSVNHFTYNAGTTYHIKMVVDVETKTYDATIKVIGGLVPTTIASQYGFRAQATQLNNFAEEADVCHLPTSNFVLTAVTDVPIVSEGLSSALIYPNPAYDEINIQVAWPTTVSIFNIQGKLLLTKNIQQGTTRLPINLNPGLYIIRINDNNNVFHSRKLIVH